MNYFLTLLQAYQPSSGGYWSFIILIVLIALIAYGISLFNKKKRINNPNFSKNDSSKYFYISKKVAFGVIGGIAGIFLSIYFQNGAIQSMGISEYLEHLSELSQGSESGNFNLNILISIIVFSAVGALIGHFLDKEKKNESQ